MSAMVDSDHRSTPQEASQNVLDSKVSRRKLFETGAKAAIAAGSMTPAVIHLFEAHEIEDKINAIESNPLRNSSPAVEDGAEAQSQKLQQEKARDNKWTITAVPGAIYLIKRGLDGLFFIKERLTHDQAEQQ